MKTMRAHGPKTPNHSTIINIYIFLESKVGKSFWWLPPHPPPPPPPLQK